MNCPTKKRKNGSESTRPPVTQMLITTEKTPIGLVVTRSVFRFG